MTKGWNISNDNLNYIFKFIDEMQPKNEKEERDKYILECAFVRNMSALSIAKMNDPIIIGYGNRAKGQQLTHTQISRIINSYNLIYEKKFDYTMRNHYHRRKALKNKVQKGEIKKPKICGCCGSTKNLELHHIVPMEISGTDEYYNLLYLCHDCHQKMHRNIIEHLTERRLENA